jgi:hypothetical protein
MWWIGLLRSIIGFRSPEAVVKIVKHRGDGFVAEFSRSFCATCGSMTGWRT